MGLINDAEDGRGGVRTSLDSDDRTLSSCALHITGLTSA